MSAFHYFWNFYSSPGYKPGEVQPHTEIVLYESNKKKAAEISVRLQP